MQIYMFKHHGRAKYCHLKNMTVVACIKYIPANWSRGISKWKECRSACSQAKENDHISSIIQFLSLKYLKVLKWMLATWGGFISS